jgi:hypothetical protein
MQVVVNDEDTVGQPHSLGPVRNGLLVRPPRRYDTSAQIGEILLRNVDVEGADRVAVECGSHFARKNTERTRGCGRREKGPSGQH